MSERWISGQDEERQAKSPARVRFGGWGGVSVPRGGWGGAPVPRGGWGGVPVREKRWLRTPSPSTTVAPSPAQIALAWVLMQGKHIIPIPGTKRLLYLEENASATLVDLTSSDLEEIDDMKPAAGDRYPERALSFVNR